MVIELPNGTKRKSKIIMTRKLQLYTKKEIERMISMRWSNICETSKLFDEPITETIEDVTAKVNKRCEIEQEIADRLVIPEKYKEFWLAWEFNDNDFDGHIKIALESVVQEYRSCWLSSIFNFVHKLYYAKYDENQKELCETLGETYQTYDEILKEGINFSSVDNCILNRKDDLLRKLISIVVGYSSINSKNIDELIEEHTHLINYFKDTEIVNTKTEVFDMIKKNCYENDIDKEISEKNYNQFYCNCELAVCRIIDGKASIDIL